MGVRIPPSAQEKPSSELGFSFSREPPWRRCHIYVALLFLAGNLTYEHGGITASIALDVASDREIKGGIAFSYRGEPGCKFAFELSPLLGH